MSHQLIDCDDCGEIVEWLDCDRAGHDVECFVTECPKCLSRDYDCDFPDAHTVLVSGTYVKVYHYPEDYMSNDEIYAELIAEAESQGYHTVEETTIILEGGEIHAD